MSERDEMRADMRTEHEEEVTASGLDRALERALDPAEVSEIMRLDAALRAYEAGTDPSTGHADNAEDPGDAEIAALFGTARAIDHAFGAMTETRSFHSFHSRSRAAVLHQLEAERPVPFRERVRVLVPAAAGLAAVAISISAFGAPALESLRSDSGNGANVTVANLTPITTQDQLDRLGLAVEGIRTSALSGQTLSSAQLHNFTESSAQVANAIERQPDALSPDAVRSYIERAQAAREALSTGLTEPGAEGAAAAAQRAAEDGIIVASRYLGESVTQGSDTPTTTAPSTETPAATATATPEVPADPEDGDSGNEDGEDGDPDAEAPADGDAP